MKTITTVTEQKITLTGSEWFVTMTDKCMSGWGRAEGKTAKRVIICKSHADAETLRQRLQNPKYGMRYVNVTATLPYYAPSKYTTSYEIDNGRLFRW